ncbi:MAG: outer membrane biosynthesis protein TonB [Myxococcota bacterium]|jgi:outer membrane biosynthesis protein TonB
MTSNTTDKRLRIGIIQHRRVMAERVIRESQDIRLGRSAKNTFVVDAVNAPKSVPLFRQRGAGYELVFSATGAGRVDLDGSPMTLSELASTAKVGRAGNRLVLPLPTTARGKLVFGDVTVLFQFVEVPALAAVAKTPRKPSLSTSVASLVEWPLVYALVVCFLTIGGGGAALDMWWNQTGKFYYNGFETQHERLYEQLTAEAEMTAEMTPPEDPPEAEPKPDTEPDPDATPTAEATPEPLPPKPVVRQVKRAPSQRRVPRRKVSDRVSDKTFLGVLGVKTRSGQGALDALQNGVRDMDFAAAMGGTEGVVTERGEGAAGPRRTADAEGSKYHHLDQDDTGGRRLAARRVVTKEKTQRDEIKVRGSIRDARITKPTGTGKVDTNAIIAVFKRRKGAIKHCYEQRLQRKPDLSGIVKVSFTLGPAGRLTALKTLKNTTGDVPVAQCILKKLRGWRFTPPTGGSVTFQYPFLLEKN